MQTKSIKIKVFKATEDILLSKRFIRGHRNVLASYNVPKITSDNNEWIYNPDVYVLVVEDLNNQIVGGARIHIKNEEYALPIEEAFKKHNDFTLWMNRHKNKRVGEMCGLWNAKSIAGTGVSLLLTRSILSKSGIVLANQLQLDTLLCLCAPWTVQLVKDFGFSVAKEVGANGTYPYPKPDLPATIMYVEDTENLQLANKVQRPHVLNLRTNPVQTKIETRDNVSIKVDYNLLIPSLNQYGETL